MVSAHVSRILPTATHHYRYYYDDDDHSHRSMKGSLARLGSRVLPLRTGVKRSFLGQPALASAHQYDEEHNGAHAINQGAQSTHRVQCVELAGWRLLLALLLLWRRWLVLVRRLLRIGGELGHLLGAEGW